VSALFGTPRIDSVASAISAAFSALGSTQIYLPTVQPLLPYLEFLGEAYRQNIVEHDGDQSDLCLCPDLTLALALQIASGETETGAYQLDGLVFRGSRGNSGASPVQRHIGVELFDAPENAQDDGSVVEATISALKAAGANAFTLTFADPGLVFRLIDSFDLHENWKARLKKSFSMPATFERDMADAMGGPETPALPRALASLSRDEAKDDLADMFEMVNITPFGARSLEDIADRLIDKAKEAEQPLKASDAEALKAVCGVDAPLSEALDQLETLLAGRSSVISERLAYWRGMADQLAASGGTNAPRFDANLGRELSYYDGFVFECHAPDGTVLGGGGRYDGLIVALSGHTRTSGAVGAMLRPDRIADMLAGGA